MGDKPKKSDYKPSAAEKASAAVAMAEHRYFKEKYDPLLQEERDASMNDDTQALLRGRANADTMQTLAGSANYDRAATGVSGGDEAQAYQAQLGLANETGLDIKRKRQLAVLGTARGQQADASGFMASAANMGASRVLTKAQAKQTTREAKLAMVGQLGSALVYQGGKNMRSKTPKGNISSETGKFVQSTDGDTGELLFNKGSFFKRAS
jgi:hypothetical protein